MNEWLTRGLISVTAGALSTFAIVKSAGQSSDEKPDTKTSRSERSGRKKKSKNTQTSPSQGAALPESGLDLETWWSGVKRSGVRAGQHVGKILNGEPPAPEERSKESEEQSEPQNKRSSSKGGAKVSHDLSVPQCVFLYGRAMSRLCRCGGASVSDIAPIPGAFPDRKDLRRGRCSRFGSRG